MLTLGIHTAGPACDVAIVRGADLLAQICEPMTRGQDAWLAGLVAKVAAEASVTLGELDRIGVVTGPGSFTGVRVGVAFARGLAIATGADCLGVTSLAAALPAGQQGSAIVILPAQRRAPDITFWTQRFQTGAPTGPAEEMLLDDLVSLLAAHPLVIYGSGTALVARQPDLKIHLAEPSAARAAQLVVGLSLEENPPVPTYARALDAALPGGKRA